MALYHVLIGYQLGGRQAANVFYYDCTDAIGTITDPTDPADIATKFGVDWVAQWRTFMPTGVQFGDVIASKVDGTGKATYSATVSGTNPNPATAPNVAYLVRKNIANSSRGGRMYLPGVAEAAIDQNGVITGGTPGDINTRANAFLLGVQGETNNRLQIRTKFGSGGFVYRNILSFSVDGKVATQRRRLRG